MAASAQNTQLKVQTKLRRANILGVGVHAINLRSAVDALERHISGLRKEYVCVASVHGVMEARRSAEFRSILDHALLVVPDGMPLVWLGRLQKCSIARVFGP